MRRHVVIVGGVALFTVLAGVAVAASASAGTTTYEAEAASNTLDGGAHALDCDRCSGGQRVTGIGLLGSLTFTHVMAAQSGSTRVAIVYTSTDARVAQLSVNGGVGVAVAFPATRGENRIGTLRIVAQLKAGDNTFTVGNPTGPAPDLDKLVITTDGTPPPPVIPAAGPGTQGDAATAASAPTSFPPPAPSAPAPVPSGLPATIEPTGSNEQTGPIPRTMNEAFEADVVRLVNAERAKAGLPPVVVDPKLSAAAAEHSADMTVRHYFAHTSPDGVTFSQRLSQSGLRWKSAGENIAKGQHTPDEVMAGWMGSTGHRANILKPGFTRIGVGVVADRNGTLLWTQDFAS